MYCSNPDNNCNPAGIEMIFCLLAARQGVIP